MADDQQKDPLDADAAVERLNAALRLQHRFVERRAAPRGMVAARPISRRSSIARST
jgi:hypothetical protein